LSRLSDLIRFYEILGRLEARQQGPKTLNHCHARMGWTLRGVYFFFEPGEIRSDSGNGLRIVRVGTHGVSRGAKSTLWMRLSQHRGSTTGSGGNHRGSVFRLLVGAAICARDPSLNVPSWGQRQSAAKSVRAAERELEAAVSRYIGVMPFLHLAVNDEPSPESMRAYLERNSIALLSNSAGAAREVLDEFMEQMYQQGFAEGLSFEQILEYMKGVLEDIDASQQSYGDKDRSNSSK